MKSVSNTTEFDDELYYRAIVASLKCIMISPVEGKYNFLSNEKKMIFELEKMTAIKAAASGIIISVEETEKGFFITLQHKFNINTTYGPLKKPDYKTTGIEIKQGITIGWSKELEFTIEVIPLVVFN